MDVEPEVPVDGMPTQAEFRQLVERANAGEQQSLAELRRVLDHRTDIYSLGITLYELLALQPPFDGANRQSLLRQISDTDPPPLFRQTPAIPADLQTIVFKAIAKNAAQRYLSAGDFADDLRRFLSDTPIRARPPTLACIATKTSSRWATATKVATNY